MKAFLLKLGRFLMSDTLFLLLVGAVTLQIAIGIAFAIGEARPGYVIGWSHLFKLVLYIFMYVWAGVLLAHRMGVKRG